MLERATEAESILLAQPTVEIVQTSVPGEGDSSFGTIMAALQGQPANSAIMNVRLDPGVDLAQQTEASVRRPRAGQDRWLRHRRRAECRLHLEQPERHRQWRPDANKSAAATQTVLGAISDRTDLTNLKSDLVRATPEIQVHVDPNKAIGAGTTAAQIAAEVRAALSATTVGTISLDGTGAADLVMRVDPALITSVEQLRMLPVGTVQRVPLGQVADVEQVDVQGSITRIEGAPAAQITAEIASADTGKVSAAIKAQIDDSPPRAHCRLVSTCACRA